jgi:RNA polymerase sigma-70 factor, ECF subfamily
VAVTPDDAIDSLAAMSSARGDVVDATDRLRLEVERAVRKVCPRWLVDQVDDLTQVVTARIVQRMRDTADSSVVFTAGYVYRAAYTALIDEIRRRRRLRETPIESEPLIASQTENPEQRVAARSIRAAVATCVSALMGPRRRAVVLKLQGYSLDEMSVVLESPRKRVENLLYRGLADLRQCLVSKGIHP